MFNFFKKKEEFKKINEVFFIVKITNDIPRFDYEQENLTKVKTY